jgi:CubicO group peptidase (beta-lactamase class C family)
MIGEIVRRAEGNHELQDIMQRRIWGPLGMRETHILDEPHERLSTGYHRAPNDDTRFQLERAGIPVPDEKTVDGLNIRGAFTPDFNRAMRAAGGVQSTIPDMARYAPALLRRGNGIVSEDTFAAMVAPVYCPNPRLQHHGLAFALTTHHGRKSFGHGGAYFGGWNSHIDVFPDEGVAILQHMNIMLDEPAPIFRRIIRAVFGDQPTQYAPRPVDPAMLAQAPGEYVLPMPGPLTNFRPATRLGPIRIEADGDALTLTSRWGNWKAGVPLVPADDTDPALFAINRDGDDAALVAFTRDADGNINGLRCDDLVRFDKRDRNA